ncbi:MAG: bifunctional 4-hydroxy-2-oxoglutarate aldolase/2-dehydro-3-deoxy-phosphogluconate aldolase [Bacteroidales bacterium]|nr:bifunctional 4-hydroxy-2-oxoglutarate aldolase/2-dehydro-3-deoxy-phosphogluconate aldolase [Bacteroidales bacterium]
MIVAIIRGFEPDVCLRLAEAYRKGGIDMVEVTFNQKNPESWKDTASAISAIKKNFGSDMKVGAGTVLTMEQLTICEDAGGQFMVTPNVNPELIRKCVADSLIAMPGALTPTEAMEAWNAGADYVKIFPAGQLGPGYIKAIKAPLSQIPFLAVGGIGPDNIADFIKAGCVGAGVGGNLTNKEWIAAGEWDKITAVAEALVANSKI